MLLNVMCAHKYSSVSTISANLIKYQYCWILCI